MQRAALYNFVLALPALLDLWVNKYQLLYFLERQMHTGFLAGWRREPFLAPRPRTQLYFWAFLVLPLHAQGPAAPLLCGSSTESSRGCEIVPQTHSLSHSHLLGFGRETFCGSFRSVPSRLC